jgi:hypothetical protein
MTSRRTTARTLLLFTALGALIPSTVRAQAASPAHESELDELAFPPLAIEPEIVSFPDPYFAYIGQKIQVGTASLQERRWWYRVAERLAPFRNPPPADWQTLTVKLLDPLGNVAGTGGALISGFTASGLDALVSTPGTWTVQILVIGLGDNVTISIVRDSRVQ